MMIKYIPLFLILGGCAAMESLGLYDSASGEPTDTAKSLSDMAKGISGIDAIAIWKSFEALFTKRGRDNLKNVFNWKTGFVPSIKSVVALAVGSHSPKESKK